MRRLAFLEVNLADVIEYQSFVTDSNERKDRQSTL